MSFEWSLNCLSPATMLSALGRIRTCDTRFRKPMLYPLSYEGGGRKRLRKRLRKRFQSRFTCQLSISDGRRSRV